MRNESGRAAPFYSPLSPEIPIQFFEHMNAHLLFPATIPDTARLIFHNTIQQLE